jgi:hypothetical protein
MTTPIKETRVKDIAEMAFYFQDGFSGTSAIDDASISATDTVLGVDTHSLRDSRTIVPVGARFTTAGIATLRTVTATQNSQVFTLDMTAPTAGTFDITINGQTASSQAYDIAAATFQANLEALSSVGSGNISVVENADVYTITFQGTLANISTNTLTVDGSSLTASNSHVLTTTQDGTTTWEVTFTPAIAAGSVPSDDDVITWYPRRIEFEVETGDLAWTETFNPNVRLSRQRIAGLRRGEEAPMEVTSAFVFDWMRTQTTDTNPLTDLTPYECLHQIGFASDWLPSSHGGVCEPYTIDLVVVDSPDCSSQQAEIFIFPQFAKQTINPSVNDGIVNLSGLCVAERPIITRVANNADAIGIIF